MRIVAKRANFYRVLPCFTRLLGSGRSRSTQRSPTYPVYSTLTPHNVPPFCFRRAVRALCAPPATHAPGALHPRRFSYHGARVRGGPPACHLTASEARGAAWDAWNRYSLTRGKLTAAHPHSRSHRTSPTRPRPQAVEAATAVRLWIASRAAKPARWARA